MPTNINLPADSWWRLLSHQEAQQFLASLDKSDPEEDEDVLAVFEGQNHKTNAITHAVIHGDKVHQQTPVVHNCCGRSFAGNRRWKNHRNWHKKNKRI